MRNQEDRWTSLNDKRHQNASAILCPWCDFVSLVDNPLNWFQANPAPAPHDGADHTRAKQVLFQAVERSGSREAPYDLVALLEGLHRDQQDA